MKEDELWRHTSDMCLEILNWSDLKLPQLVIGLAVGITIIIGFVKAENYRSKLRSELVSSHTHTLFFRNDSFLQFFLMSGEYGGCFREDDGGGFEEAFAC